MSAAEAVEVVEGKRDFWVEHGDCRQVVTEWPEGCVDALVTDPPYHLTQASRHGSPRKPNPGHPAGRHRNGDKGFMGKIWDGGGVTFDPETWVPALRVLKPGGYLLSFGGTRTYHRLVCALEDAGFEIRDSVLDLFDSDPRLEAFVGSLTEEQMGAFGELFAPASVLAWMYGTGFPKGPGCLKPGWEPVVLARKPGRKVLPLQVDACRIGYGDKTPEEARKEAGRPGRHGGPETRSTYNSGWADDSEEKIEFHPVGRWPPNVVLDDTVAGVLGAMSGMLTSGQAPAGGLVRSTDKHQGVYAPYAGKRVEDALLFGDSGTAARFFYTAKADKKDREGSRHPTMKPTSVVSWLVKLVAKPGDLVADLFAGSGTTGVCCRRLGVRFLGVEERDTKEEPWVSDARRRVAAAGGVEEKILGAMSALGD